MIKHYRLACDGKIEKIVTPNWLTHDKIVSVASQHTPIISVQKIGNNVDYICTISGHMFEKTISADNAKYYPLDTDSQWCFVEKIIMQEGKQIS